MTRSEQQFWVTFSNRWNGGRVHYVGCRYFNKGYGQLLTIAQMPDTYTNCRLCGGIGEQS